MKSITSTLKDPIFRGQGNTFRGAGCSDFGWRLEPSLYRIQKASHPRFIECVKTILTNCQDELFKTVDHRWGNDVDEDRDLIIGLMRHLGFPTPLLDWTKNPFVAAYFAFDRIHKCSDGVSIFLFDQKAWLNKESYLTSRDLEILNLRELDHTIPRQKAQDCVYTYSRHKRVFGELVGDELEGGEYFIAHCTIPTKDRGKALQDLDEMGIFCASLFPDVEQVTNLENLLGKIIKDLCDLDNSI